MTDRKEFDLIVLGAGPGGYVAAIKAAQAGMKVGLIEKEYLGGTCLNVGCIPTKTLISHAEVLEQIHEADKFGITVKDVSFDFEKVKKRKDTVLEGIRNSLEGLIRANQITILKGKGTFLGPKELKVQGEDNLIVKAKKIIIATGSSPMDIPAFPCDHKKILNSTSVLDLTKLPKKIAIVGGGYIGCEFASLYRAFGVEVVILEALPAILMTQPKIIQEQMTKIFTNKGIEIKCDVLVEKIESLNNDVKLHLKGGNIVDADLALISVGRSINTKDMGLEKTGVDIHEKGWIITDDQMKTNVDDIYAIGDVTGKFMLAHVASHQAIIAAQNAAGQKTKMHYEAVPAVIFTHPEIATVGLSLDEANKKGYSAKLGSFPFQALGKAQATGDTEGFAQIVIDSKTGQVLGAQVIGKEASCLIAEMALAIHNELTVECIFDTIHAHPTLPEAWMEAALIANGSPIHFPPKRKR